MTNKDLFEALRTFEKEKGIPMDYMLQNIEKAISVACKNYYGGNENVVFKVDPEKNSFDAKLVKTVVDEVFDPNFEVTVEEAQQINKRKKFIVGDEVEVPIDPKHLGWTSVSSARNVIRQGIRQGENSFHHNTFCIVCKIIKRIVYCLQPVISSLFSHYASTYVCK